MIAAQPAGLTSKAKAMLRARCPRCRRGNMFGGGPYHFGSNRIQLDCPACRLTFEIEPDYFYAAMYVSYALNVAEGLTLAADLAAYRQQGFPLALSDGHFNRTAGIVAVTLPLFPRHPPLLAVAQNILPPGVTGQTGPGLAFVSP